MFLAESSIQLVPDGTLLLHLVVVGLMVVVLNRTLLKPINRILSERDKSILGREKEAQRMFEEREAKLKAYNSALRDARTEGYRLLEAARAVALKERDEKLLLYKEELRQLVAVEIQATRQQEEEVRRDLEAKATVISNIISTQILGRPTA
jgi:F0F1-type ATP synthase membrane subunit b/b'